MSAPVDVLAVMDGARRTISAQSKLSDDVMAHIADDVSQARAAVAELIAAARDVSVARKWWEGEGSDSPKSALSHYTRAATRLDAALARVTGGQP